MGAVGGQPRRPRGSGSIQWKNGRPYAVYRDLITGKPRWEGFDNEEEAEAFLAQWAADRKAAKLAVKATNGVFVIELSDSDADVQRNIQLLKENQWFDIPIVYINGSRAILAIEKGPAGDRAFAEAFAAWEKK